MAACPAAAKTHENPPNPTRHAGDGQAEERNAMLHVQKGECRSLAALSSQLSAPGSWHAGRTALDRLSLAVPRCVLKKTAYFRATSRFPFCHLCDIICMMRLFVVRVWLEFRDRPSPGDVGLSIS